MSKILIVDSDAAMARCMAYVCRDYETEICSDAFAAMNAIVEGELPQLIFLEIVLDGLDGVAFLNELVSYEDTARIPVVVATAIPMGDEDLSDYGVVGVLDKATMLPDEVRAYVAKYCK